MAPSLTENLYYKTIIIIPIVNLISTGEPSSQKGFLSQVFLEHIHRKEAQALANDQWQT